MMVGKMSISCVGSMTTFGSGSDFPGRPSKITIGTDAEASRGTIL